MKTGSNWEKLAYDLASANGYKTFEKNDFNKNLYLSLIINHKSIKNEKITSNYINAAIHNAWTVYSC